MEILHILEVELYGVSGILPGAMEFATAYEAYRPGPTLTTFVFPEGVELESALADLAARALVFQHIYTFKFRWAELLDYPGFGFGLPCLYDVLFGEQVNLKALRKREMALDYASGRLVFAARIRDAIAPFIAGAHWRELESAAGQAFALEVQATLRDPLLILQPFEVTENALCPGTYSLVYDGRAVISERDIETLRRCGLCYADRMTVNGVTLPRHPMPLLASGRLMHALHPFLKGRAKAEFSALLTASHPLAQAADTTINNVGGR
ncbi:MAG: hypothetical protein JW892_01190 [Anaerolineae bacterium]|nr:hypothetical protein [Anaerolineae bacterium]